MLVNYSDKSFDPSRSKLYTLSIQINLDGLSFCIYDTQLQKQVCLKQFEFKKCTSGSELAVEVQSLIASDLTLQLEFKTCTCLYVAPTYLLIPAVLFDPLSLRNYLETSVCIDELDEIHYHNFPAIDIYCLYTVPSPLVACLLRKWPTSTITHQAVLFLNQALDKAPTPRCSILFNGSFIDVLLFDGLQLQLFNSYPISGMLDAIYFVNNLRVQYQFDVNGIELEGRIPEAEIELFSTYFPDPVIEIDSRIALALGNQSAYHFNSLLKLHQATK